MQLLHINISMYKLLIVASLLLGILQAKEIEINKESKVFLNELVWGEVKTAYPKLYAKVQTIKKNIESLEVNHNHDVVYLFTSSSVPIDVFEDFIIEGSVLNNEYGVEIVLVLQGFQTKEYLRYMIELNDFFNSFENGDIFIENIYTMFDPYIFKKLNIKQVPAIAIASYEKDYYPSESNMKYLIRGTTTLGYLFNLLKKDDKKYEKYFNSISSLY